MTRNIKTTKTHKHTSSDQTDQYTET